MFTRIRQWFFGESKQSPSLYQETSLRFQQMLIPTGRVYREIRLIEVLFETIDAYLAEVAKATVTLNQGRLYRLDSELTPYRTPVGAFYLSKERHCLDVEDYHRRFVEAVTQILSLYNTLEDDDALEPLQETNLRRLRVIVENLVTLSVALNP